jgi:hypothetical protein
MKRYQGFDPAEPLNRIFEEKMDILKFGNGRLNVVMVEVKQGDIRILPLSDLCNDSPNHSLV